VYLAWAQDPGTVPQGKDGKKADPRLEVRVARSDDGGRSFAPPVMASSPGDRVESSTVNPPQVAVGPKGPITLLSDDWIPYGDVKLALDTRDNAWVAFEDRRGEEDLIQVARIAPGGRATLAQAWPGTSPDLALRGDTVILFWSGAQGAKRSYALRPRSRGARRCASLIFLIPSELRRSFRPRRLRRIMGDSSIEVI